ncbi:FCD domain-containing protein [Clostridium sp. MCC353]|uniref:FadR/GntR family transcriptional regulator n=1 Tax=Clostridium sp. MCC353 TaxID=2592646 RepID=UPI001C01C72E|nr:FadR/GntR family transcriptional regulator [Clostridium sp. MCC353]MBT9777648.1 FCD domain-containing protein [Clostridium sp. MCC353]
MSLKEIKKVNVSNEVYKQILNEIVKKNLQPGDKLASESELVKTFGVSRVSVRAALQKLAGAGIIESVNGGGSYVKHLQEGAVLGGIMPMAALSQYDTSQLVDFRRGIEVLSAELAARFATDEEIIELQNIYANMQECNEKGDIESYSEYDLEFHMQIARMSKNPFVLYVMEQLREIIFVHISDLNDKKGSENGMHYHGRILQMIRSHNQSGAREYMNLNLLNTLQEVLADEDQ